MAGNLYDAIEHFFSLYHMDLKGCGFCLQLGIPNSRLRYFLIAKLHQEPFSFQASDQVSLLVLPEFALFHEDWWLNFQLSGVC